MQTILVYIIFAIALVYAGWKAYKSFTHKHQPGCPKCDSAGLKSPAGAHKKS